MRRYIDADEFAKHIKSGTPVIFDNTTTNEIIFALDTEPRVDAEPVVHAHWVLNPNGMDYGISAWTCSRCGGRNDMIPPFIPTNKGGYVPKNPNIFAGSNYCPHCGAKMDEVSE